MINKGYHLSELQKAAQAKKIQIAKESSSFINALLIDSRKLSHPEATLFFAIKSERQDGHLYIQELFGKGVRNFVVSDEEFLAQFPIANFLLVKDTKLALQKITTFHRKNFDYPVIAVTGSNGKTIVKEWLYQLLHEDYQIVKSPKSYNSQIGVPLSVWQMTDENNLGIFEAGISESDEMDNLQKIILPTIGIFTNIGEAHAEGFINRSHKVKEKLKLFRNVQQLIFCKDHTDIFNAVVAFNAQKGAEDKDKKIPFFTWSQYSDADVKLTAVITKSLHTLLTIQWNGKEYDLELGLSDRASIENAMHCVCTLLVLGKEMDFIKSKISQLSGIAMRLEMKEGINHCTIINDSYNSDFESIKIAVEFLHQQNHQQQKIIILSDILQSGRNEIDLYSDVAKLIKATGVHRFIGIGTAINRQRKAFEERNAIPSSFYLSVEDFLNDVDVASFSNEIILLKAARKFQFERIAKLFENKTHSTVLEINLNAVVHNLRAYQSRLDKSTKVMCMVKAFSYGSGSFEIANVLQFQKVAYLAVAYTDEGVELRKGGITLPIMVMNPEERTFEQLIAYQLEPEIYSIYILEKYIHFTQNRIRDKRIYKIHLELETGMNRLGFIQKELPILIQRIKDNEHLQIASVFSHLAGSDAESLDFFTKNQIEAFDEMSKTIQAQFDYKIIRHILNSNGISRHSYAQFDMVRLGIGMYGIDHSNEMKGKLLPVSTLKTIVAQIKTIKKGESIGYNRKSIAQRDSIIATVNIGYADGLPRMLSNGNGYMLIKNQQAPIIGNICMDMTMLDITAISGIKEGDEVIVFGEKPTVQEIADATQTIAYEILTGISARVKRIYFHE